jgi:ABC-type phosphate transport system substrate-binding protein
LAKVGTSKAGSTISQLGCGTSVAYHGKPIKKEEEEEEEEERANVTFLQIPIAYTARALIMSCFDTVDLSWIVHALNKAM